MIGEADMSITNMAMGTENMGGQNPDDSLLVKFFIEPLKNEAKSKEEGRPIFEDAEWISIRIPGSRDEVRRPVRLGDIDRFPRHYQKFKLREEQTATEGTLLSEWAGATRSQVEELKFFNVLTVEQLAGMPDNKAMSIRGMITLKEQAKAFLENAKENSAALALEEANEKIQAQDEQIAQLMARLDAIEAPKPKRKRRTKAQIEADKASEE
jgi:hypothetical protein